MHLYQKFFYHLLKKKNKEIKSKEKIIFLLKMSIKYV